MVGPGNFVDDIDCGSFFDHIDDLLDFPTDEIEACLTGPDNNNNSNGKVNSFPSIWTTHSDSLPGSDSVFSPNQTASDLSAELSVPYEDIVQLEWLSNFVEDSFCGGGSLTMNKEESTSISKYSSNKFHTSSPVSVLESSSSCSGDPKTAPRSPETVVASGKRGRPRSKRPRPATFVPRLAMQLISPTSDSENCVESRLEINSSQHKKKRIKVTMLSLGEAEQVQNVRRCMHCEISKTPQWRAGPLGPKTLCNACGVRYKSGRLFPEYRPAASPTFVPSLHSNSHKRVIEMRNRVSRDAPEFISNYSALHM